MKKINCLGDFCPIPLLKVKDAISHLNINDSVMLVTDHSCVLESVTDYFKNTNISYTYEEVLNGVWEITFTKNA